MTSNDVPVPGGSAGRRRALGRGPGAEPVASPVEAESELAEAESEPVAEAEAPAGTGEPEEASDGVFKVRLANFEGPSICCSS